MRVREHRASLHSRDTGVKRRCDRELSLSGMAFPLFEEHPKDTCFSFEACTEGGLWLSRPL